MKRCSSLIGIGFLPILLGFCSRLLFLLPIPLFLSNLLFFALWVWACFRFFRVSCPLLPQLLCVCTPGAIVTALAICQELVPGSNLPGIIVSASSFYYFSGLAMAGRILQPFLRSIIASPYILTSYLSMTVLCLLVMVFKKKVT